MFTDGEKFAIRWAWDMHLTFCRDFSDEVYTFPSESAEVLFTNCHNDQSRSYIY